jgi:hypothetical protein
MERAVVAASLLAQPATALFIYSAKARMSKTRSVCELAPLNLQYIEASAN